MKTLLSWRFSSKKTLFHRLGGEPTLLKSLELFFNKVQADPVLIKYVRNIKINKVIEHQKRILMVAFGGSPGMTAENMRKSHKSLNISDIDFDVLKALLQETFEQMDISHDLTLESLDLLEKYRKNVVADTIFQKMSGETGMKKLIDLQYEKVLSDPELRLFFLTSDIAKVKENSMAWLTKAFGGANNYKGRDLREVHKNMDLTDRHFYLMKKHLAWGFYKSGANSFLIDKALDIIEKDRYMILGCKTTYEELGEDIGLKQIVEGTMRKAMENPMLNSFINEDNLQRVSKGFYEFMAKELGDVKKNDKNFDLKLIHSKFNLTDMHLDAFQNCMEQVLKEKFTNPVVIRDVLWSLDRYRRKVCSISIYDLVGGEEFIAKAANIMLKKLKFHYRLAIFFKNLKDDQILLLMKNLLTYSMGGRRSYRGRDMKNAHEGLGIKNEHFLDMKHLVKETFKELGVVDSLILQVMRIYDDKKRYVVHEKKDPHESIPGVSEDILD